MIFRTSMFHRFPRIFSTSRAVFRVQIFNRSFSGIKHIFPDGFLSQVFFSTLVFLSQVFFSKPFIYSWKLDLYLIFHRPRLVPNQFDAHQPSRNCNGILIHLHRRLRYSKHRVDSRTWVFARYGAVPSHSALFSSHFLSWGTYNSITNIVRCWFGNVRENFVQVSGIPPARWPWIHPILIGKQMGM